MRFGRLPDSFGQTVAAQPWLLGFYPGHDRLGWLAARDHEVVAVGAAQIERASIQAYAHLFTRELEPHEFDTLVVTGPLGTLAQQGEFASHVATAGQRVDLVEIHADQYRRQGSADWQQTPPPPMPLLLSGRAEPALSFEDLTARYDLLPGPHAVEYAPVLSHVQKSAVDRLRPRSRFERAMNEIQTIASPGREIDPNSVARLGYLMTDPFVRGAVLHQVLADRDAIAALVSAHRVAHVDEGADLRGATAMAVYATAAVPTVADWVAVHAEDATLSQQVRKLIVGRVPSEVPRSMILGRGPMASLADQDEEWLSAQARPLPSRIADLQRRLEQLQDPTKQDGPGLPPLGPPPSPSGPQL